MVEDIKTAPPASGAWAPAEVSDWKPQPRTPLARFLGGSPVRVFLRLLVLSLLVGALLMWLEIRPYDIIDGVVGRTPRVMARRRIAVRHRGGG